MPKQLRIYPEKCIGCKSCELACSLANDGQLNPSLSRITALVFREANLYALPYNFPTTCKQCADAPCIRSCPVDAISRQQNISKVVSVNHEACIHCGRCVSACPFGAMLFDRVKREPYKCELCNGEEPACAAICPTGSIVFKRQKPFYSKAHTFQAKAFAVLSQRNKNCTRRSIRAEK